MKRNKKIATGIILIVIAIMAAMVYLARPIERSGTIVWGVTFSQKFAQLFDGINWQNAYTAVLDDLAVRRLRLVAYWDLVEPKEGVFDFSDLDWQLEEAGKRGVRVILAVGRKLPRWPECHVPEWAQNHESRITNQALLKYIAAVVGRYNDHPAIGAWQVENEPFLPFGVCPEFDVALLEEEIALVRSLSSKPIVVTDSGELSTWYRAVKRADIFGTTMYRQIQNDTVGIQTYPIPAAFFRLKTRLVKMFPDTDKPFVVIELQGEPWMKKQPYETYPEQLEVLPVEKFKEYINYAGRTGFDTYYLWGAEWWYWLKETKGHPEYWEYVKMLAR